jgi:hypothetical protein
MSKHRVLALLAAGLLAGAGLTPAADEAPARTRRAVYVVRHGAANDLADVLGKDFKGDAAVQVLPYAPSNCLLVSAPPGVLDEVIKLLDHLDRPAARSSPATGPMAAEVSAPGRTPKPYLGGGKT